MTAAKMIIIMMMMMMMMIKKNVSKQALKTISNTVNPDNND